MRTRHGTAGLRRRSALARCVTVSVLAAAILAAAASIGCLGASERPAGESSDGSEVSRLTESRELDALARDYVRLARTLIASDPDSSSGDSAVPVSADAGQSSSLSLAEIESSASAAALRAHQLREASTEPDDPERAERAAYIAAQLEAVAARAALLQGARATLDEELERLYGVQVPPHPAASTSDEGSPDSGEDVRREIARLLPGSGSAAARLAAFEAAAIVPREKLPAVFERALAECRSRSESLIQLPEDESVEVGYVIDRPWSGFSRFLGAHRSRIEVNTNLPLTVDRALDLACHEGYPGHHAIDTWRDVQRARRGAIELEAVPMFSPASYLAEARAADAAALVFSDADRLAFERDVLFPLAGLNPSGAEAQVRISRLLARLRPTIAAIVVRYLRGEYDYVEAAWALTGNALMAHPQATLAFVHSFRGFALAYTGWVSMRDGAAAGDAVAAAGWSLPPALRESGRERAR